MKKLFDAVFPQLVYIAIAAMLVATIINPTTGFANVALVFIWALMAISIMISIMILLMGIGIPLADSKEAREKLADGLKKCVGKFIKRSAFRKAISRVQTIILVGLMAYIGFIWTAVFYALASAMSGFVVLVSKEVLDKYEAEKAKAELAAATPAAAEATQSNF